MTAQLVQVRLELGHRAAIRDKVTDDGFTHNWSVFVRGPDGCNIQEFVEKVIFYLHADFPKPKRVLRDPPYQVNECGYAGFIMPIDVFFKNKEEPKLLSFEYDMFLHMEGPPVNHIRLEKLTFQNPTEDFRRKLLKSGGVEVNQGGEGDSNMVLAEAQSTVPDTPKPSNMVLAEAQSTVPDTPKPGRPRLSDIAARPAASKLTPTVGPQHQYSSTSRECSPDSSSDSRKRQKVNKPIRL